MNPSSFYVLIAIVALAAIAIFFFLVKPAGQRRKLSQLAALAFAFVIAGILFGKEPWLGYGLMGMCVLLAVVDIKIKYILKS